MRLCPCGRHTFRHATKEYFIAGANGLTPLDTVAIEDVPRECRQALDPTIIGWTSGGVAVHSGDVRTPLDDDV